MFALVLVPLTLAQTVLAVCVGLFTATAAFIDLRTRRVPNWLTVPVFVLGVIFQGVFHGWRETSADGALTGGLLDAGLGFLVGFGTLFILWLIGGGGGGDAKLMGALSVWLGFRPTLYVLILSTVFVLLGSVAATLAGVLTGGDRKSTPPPPRSSSAGGDSRGGERRGSESANLKPKRRVMTYAFPVALATWLVMLWKLPLL